MKTKQEALAPSGAAMARKDIQEVWFALAQREWTALTIVPADGGTGHQGLATSFAELARLLGAPRITTILASDFSHKEVAAIASVVSGAREVRSTALAARAGTEEIEVQSGDEPRLPQPSRPPDRVVVEIPSVVDLPLGLAVAQASDLVLILVALGKTKLKSVQRTAELVGHDRVAGCVLVR